MIFLCQLGLVAILAGGGCAQTRAAREGPAPLVSSSAVAAVPACRGMFEYWESTWRMAMPDGGSELCDPDASPIESLDLKTAGDTPTLR